MEILNINFMIIRFVSRQPQYQTALQINGPVNGSGDPLHILTVGQEAHPTKAGEDARATYLETVLCLPLPLRNYKRKQHDDSRQ